MEPNDSPPGEPTSVASGVHSCEPKASPSPGGQIMDQYRRYGRWLKRAAWILVIYLFAAWLFMGLSPAQSVSDPELVISQLRPFMLQAMILVFFIILQFGAMFWFLSRGNDYVIYPNEYDTSFDDVRGQPAAVESTKEVLRVFEGFKDFKQMGGYPPHGILFEGPPGTGKTLMAKAIAGASGVPFLFATGSGFANMFIGIGNLKVRRLFKKARVMSDKYGGSVIFIDEIDAVGSRGAVTDRSVATADQATHRLIMGAGMGGGAGMGVINELLVQMDGFTVPRGLWRHIRRLAFRAKPKIPFFNILVIGATNRASTLDPALLRPGRFDRKIHVGLPIEKRESALGLVSRQPLEETYLRTQKQMVADIQISLAGYVAEHIWFGQVTSGPSSDLQTATLNAALYVGMFGMGRSLISASLDADQIETAIGATLGDPERRKEIDTILNDCRESVRNLLLKKRKVVEGVRDALLDREELVGDEIEVLMAELGEREPIEPTGTIGNGQGQGP